jgi:signal peptidase II
MLMALFKSLSGVPNRCHRLMWPLLVATIIATVDQVVKLAVLTARPQIPIIPGFFALNFVTNTGVAFGIFQGFSTLLAFLGLAIVAGLLFYLPRASRLASPVELAALSLVLGGAVGNLVDRARLGHVVDYLDFFIGSYHWPAFNLADSAIFVGVSMLAFLMFRREGHGRT